MHNAVSLRLRRFLLFDYSDVDRRLILDRSAQPPAGPFQQLFEFVAREEEVVEPGRRVVPVADSEPDLAGHPSAPPVSLVIGEMGRVVCRIRVQGLPQNATSRRRQSMEATKQAPRAGRTSEESEVGSEHDDRVEDPECFAEMLDRDNARVAYASSPARFDSKWRVVDRDHLLPPFLKVQRHPTTSAPEIRAAA